jgi:hypothetical protein
MVDPFEEHPSHDPVEKKQIKTLTLDMFSAILEEKIAEVQELPPRTWGFPRVEVVEFLKDVLEKAKAKCND